MKVLIGIHYFPPHVGGMENVARMQAEKLAAEGHDVHVLTSDAHSTKGTSEEHGYTVERIGVWNIFERKMGVPFPVFNPSLIWRAYRTVKSTDVVHLHDVFYQTSWTLALWARLLGRPVIVTQHVDMIPHPSALVRFVQWAVYRTAGRFVLSTARRIAVLNSNVESFLQKIGVPDEKIIFMPNGVDLSLFHPDESIDASEVRLQYGLPDNTPIALFVGRFVPKKGFDKLLKATSDRYHIALAGGDSPDGTSPDNVTFLGSLNSSQLAELYNAVDMFVLPSEGEGFPLTVQEAMASRLPVVISKNPGYDVYHLDDSLLMQIQPNISTIRSTLIKLADDSSLRRRMAEYSRQYATEHFSWDKNVSQLARVYEEVQ